MERPASSAVLCALPPSAALLREGEQEPSALESATSASGLSLMVRLCTDNHTRGLFLGRRCEFSRSFAVGPAEKPFAHDAVEIGKTEQSHETAFGTDAAGRHDEPAEIDAAVRLAVLATAHA